MLVWNPTHQRHSHGASLLVRSNHHLASSPSRSKLFVATEAKGEIHFHQISRSTGERVKYQKVSASAAEAQQSTGDDTPAATVTKDDIVKGYEYTKGKYVTIEPKELADLRVPSKHTMEITQFVDESEIDPEFFEKPYFVVPEDDSRRRRPSRSFARRCSTRKRFALSKIAFGGREHVVAISAAGATTG